FDVASAAKLGDEAGALGERIARVDAGLLQVRHTAWLRWRFGRAPFDPYEVVSLPPGGPLDAVAVVRMEQREGLALGWLMDVLARSGKLRRRILRAAALHLADRGAVAVATLVTDRLLMADLVRCGWVPVPSAVARRQFHTVYLPAPGRERELARLERI